MKMRAVIFHALSFCIFLISGALLKNADVDKQYPYHLGSKHQLLVQNNITFLEEGEINHEQSAIPGIHKLEQQLHEEVRFNHSGNDLANEGKGFQFLEIVPFAGKVNPMYFQALTGSVPIYLKVLSLRL